jgi:Protein phosphatase 2C
MQTFMCQPQWQGRLCTQHARCLPSLMGMGAKAQRNLLQSRCAHCRLQALCQNGCTPFIKALRTEPLQVTCLLPRLWTCLLYEPFRSGTIAPDTAARVLQVPVRFITQLQGSVQAAVDATSTQSYEYLGDPDAATYGRWLLEDVIINLAPTLLESTFQEVHADFISSEQKSGTTATVVFQCGHEMITANVGDSLAYLDTGTQVLLVTGNHRIDDNKEERERLISCGGEIAQAALDDGGKGVGPLRVWPGGLAFSRCARYAMASTAVHACRGGRCCACNDADR